MTRLAFLLALLLVLPAGAATRTDTEAAFRTWLEAQVWPLARQQRVSRRTFDAALGKVTLNWDLPGIDAPGTDTRPQKQTEFGTPSGYFREQTLLDLARIGQDMGRRNASALQRAEVRTGVPPRIVLAIWGRESGFGRVATPHDAFRVLATRAFFGPSKGYFTNELVAALTIARTRGLPLTASWAGALGQPQFMPSSYLAYAADGDGDGAADIWGSDADAIASIATYLNKHGWDGNRDWGFEVRVPETVSCALEGPDRPRTIAAWERLGVSRVSGRPFPKEERRRDASLLMPAGRHGPAFLVTPNFYVLKDYNNSDLYALFIGNAADRIEWGAGAFRGGWTPVAGLMRSDVARMQDALQRQGYDTGGADGLAGFRTRRSIGEWQQSKGLPPTCYPDAGLKAALSR